MLIDWYLPRFVATEVHQVEVSAPPDAAYAAIRRANLRDPIITALFAIRELPNRIAGRLRHDPQPAAPRSLRLDDLATSRRGWVILAEEPGSELVVGSIGRVWERDYGPVPVSATDFVGYEDPGFTKIALSFSVRPAGFDRSILRYEARTGTTDEPARRHFQRYWRLIRPGVALVMRRALARIKAEAERAQAVETIRQS